MREGECTLEVDFNGNKGFRLLNMHELLNRGELIKKAELAERYGVTEKTIQRDIDELREYLSDLRITDRKASILYDRSRSGYYLARMEREWITNKELLAICKILLESRAFCKEELDMLVGKLLVQVTTNERKQVENMIRSEQFYYAPLQHGKKLLAMLWDISQYILNNEVMKITYVRQDGVERNHEIKPVAILFSEYYFYLITFMADDRYDFPTVFRLDRIKQFEGGGIRFRVPYRDKFNDGDFRKRVQFMYSGKLRQVKFKFNGASIEAVLDRLPTAEILSKNSEFYTISVEVYGDGIDMWMRSQGEKVEVL